MARPTCFFSSNPLDFLNFGFSLQCLNCLFGGLSPPPLFLSLSPSVSLSEYQGLYRLLFWFVGGSGSGVKNEQGNHLEARATPFFYVWILPTVIEHVAGTGLGISAV